MKDLLVRAVLLAAVLATALAYAFQPLALCPNAVLVGPDNASALLSYISGAQRAVYVEAYALTWRPLADELASLAGKGVQVYVVLSAHVYGGMPTTERQLVQYMQSAGVHVAFNDHFNYVHTKAFVVDNKTVIVGSINPTYSGVGSDMGLSVVIVDKTLAEEIATVILDDYRGIYPRYDFQGVVISPINSYDALNWLLSRPGRAYAAVEEVYSSSGLADLLVNKAGLVIARVTDVPGVKTVEDLTAKVIVVGDLAYVGSINLSGSSVNKNREIGLILNCSSLARAAEALVEKWASSAQGSYRPSSYYHYHHSYYSPSAIPSAAWDIMAIAALILAAYALLRRR
ncbi:MAG: cardiolipin synthase [Thermoproteus sp.]|nr:cardiolipin synthase [Thermoproteus sp.]